MLTVASLCWTKSSVMFCVIEIVWFFFDHTSIFPKDERELDS